MKALGEYLYGPPAERTVGGILHWWESRRLTYNLAVGAVGTLSIGVVSLIGWLPPYAHGFGFNWALVVVVAVLANICYLLGPMAEIAVEKLGRGQVLPTGPVLFRMGLTFSTGLMLLPILLAGFDWVFRVVRMIFA